MKSPPEGDFLLKFSFFFAHIFLHTRKQARKSSSAPMRQLVAKWVILHLLCSQAVMAA